jgi:hypothetical protein
MQSSAFAHLKSIDFVVHVPDEGFLRSYEPDIAKRTGAIMVVSSVSRFLHTSKTLWLCSNRKNHSAYVTGRIDTGTEQ